MGESRRNIAVGMTAMAGLVGLLTLLLLFGYVPGWLEHGYQVRVDLPNASGLHEGSRVRLNGIDVGEVVYVRFRPDQLKGVVVLVRINPRVHLPQGVSAQVSHTIFGGSPTIELAIGPQVKPGQFLPRTGTPATIQGQSASLTAALGREIRSSLKKPLAQFEVLSKSLRTLSAQWTTVGANMNKLVEPRSTRQVDSGNMVGNLATVLARMDKRLAALKKLMEDVESVAGDRRFQRNLRQTVANAHTLSTRLNHDMDKLTSTIGGNVSMLGKRYAALADRLSQAVDSMRKLTDEARRGKGTLGKLLSDPSLYNNMNDTVQQLQSALDQTRLLLEKWKAEGVPIQF